MIYRLSVVVALTSVCWAGCADRTHMREGYGEANHQAMARQVVNPDAGSTGTSPGLDPQEAAILSRSYQKSLSPKDPSAAEPILFVSPQDQRMRGDYLPPPSVPGEGR